MPDRSPSRFTDMPPLGFGAIKEEVKNLPEAVFNKLDREWPGHWPSEQGPRDLLRGMVRTSQFTFRALLYIAADDPVPFKRPEYVVALPPLVRTLLDTLVNVLLLLDDLPNNARWYLRAGWRELAENCDRYDKVYVDDPLWIDWIERNRQSLEEMRVHFGISKKEAADPRNTMPYWPTPSQVQSASNISVDRAEFIQFLLDSQYKTLSQDDHLSWPGLLRRAAPLLDPNREGLNHLRQDSFWMALTLLMAILSEVNAEGRLQLTQRLGYVWGLLKSYHVFAESAYERRYAAILGSK